MKIIKLDQNSPEWRQLRLGKITGSKLGDIVTLKGDKKKIGFYQLIADRVAIEPGDEDPLERGHRLEQEAIEEFQKDSGLTVERDIGLLISDENPNIACSPDGLIIVDKKFKKAVEVKCLSSARHIQAFIEKKVPDEYYEQVLQYFIVNKDLEMLYFVFYDPRIIAKPFHYLVVDRGELKDDLKFYLDYQLKVIAEVEQLVEKIAF